jgi:hypothetical protein
MIEKEGEGIKFGQLVSYNDEGVLVPAPKHIRADTLAELDRLEKSASPGPWYVDQDDDCWSVKCEGQERWESVFDDGSANGEYSSKCSSDDRDLLVEVRNNLRAILDEIKFHRGIK